MTGTPVVALVRVDELSVFVVLFLIVIAVGLLSNRWRKGDLNEPGEWSLGGQRFGSFVTWFLQGGSIYTTYSFVAIPALVFGTGALGFYALPYLVLAYVFAYLVLPHMWDFAKARGHLTVADIVQDKFGGSKLPGVLVALTGILATMPYVALQVFGIEVSIAQLGIPIHLSLWIAFGVLALVTYISGIRAAALIAIVKDVLIWVTVVVGLIYIPIRLGGFAHIFAHVPPQKVMLPHNQWFGYATLALGSGLALFVYPHSTTGTLSASSRRAVQHNAIYLPIYTLMLGMLAMLGYMAVAAGIHPDHTFAGNVAVPGLFETMFRGPFAGFALAAIAIGALVPASVMAIAAANLFTRNILKPALPREIPAKTETHISKIASLGVKFGGVAFIVFAPVKYVVNYQLAGGVWITQTLPMLVGPLFLKWVDKWAAVAGWAAGMIWGTQILVADHFDSPLHTFDFAGVHAKIFVAVPALVLNLVVVAVGSAVSHALRRSRTRVVAEAATS